MAVLFLFAACWSFSSPFGAFHPAWWLGLIAGVLEILLGFWVSQQEFPARALLLVIWVGFFALFRGFSDILLAFEVRGLERA